MVDINACFQYHLVFVYIVNVAQCFFLGFSNVLFSLSAVSLVFVGVWVFFLFLLPFL